MLSTIATMASSTAGGTHGMTGAGRLRLHGASAGAGLTEHARAGLLARAPTLSGPGGAGAGAGHLG